MTTPNLTNTDHVSNYYYGWRTSNLTFSSSQIGLPLSTVRDWVNASFGETRMVVGTSVSLSFALILPHPSETLTPPAVLDAKGRFFESYFSSTNGNPSNVGNNFSFYKEPSGNTPRIHFNNPDFVYYCVLNSSSLNVFRCSFTGNSLNNSNYSFYSIGWVKNPLYSGTAFPRNAYYFVLNSNGNSRGGGRFNIENSSILNNLRVPTTGSADAIANYSITCQSATPGANTTDLVLRDNVSPNKALGIAPNLLKTSLPIPVGQIYRNTGVDPDGSTNPYWICVGEYGSERVLMRVWVENMTG